MKPTRPKTTVSPAWGVSAATAGALMALAWAPPAEALVVEIDARMSGSFVAGGPSFVAPGTLAQPFNPVTISLDAGTYEITNAASTGYFSGWRFNDGAFGPDNWVWHFVMAVEGGVILASPYVDAITSSQAAVAALTGVNIYNGPTLLDSTSTAGFRMSFTLDAPTTLNFYHDDFNWGLGDNWGGVALQISAVPELPSLQLAALGLSFLGVAFLLRRPPR